jgi:hypothetical protein
LILGWVALFACSLPLYSNYPRLLLPLLVPLALFAGSGYAWIGSRLAGAASKWATPAAAAAVFAAGALSARDTLALEDTGYARAAERLAREPATDRPDLVVAQHALFFYLRSSSQPAFSYDEPEAVEALESGRFRFLVTDLRLRHAPLFRRYLEEHAGELELVASIENPLPGPTLVNSLGFEGREETAERAPDEVSTIRIWRRGSPNER